MAQLPTSGVWRGDAWRITLARQDDNGARVAAAPSEQRPLWAVVLFDEDSLYGHGLLGGECVSFTGWWGPARLMQPSLRDLAETELWETGLVGLQFALRNGGREWSGFAWLCGEELRGFARFDGA